MVVDVVEGPSRVRGSYFYSCSPQWELANSCFPAFWITTLKRLHAAIKSPFPSRGQPPTPQRLCTALPLGTGSSGCLSGAVTPPSPHPPPLTPQADGLPYQPARSLSLSHSFSFNLSFSFYTFTCLLSASPRELIQFMPPASASSMLPGTRRPTTFVN